MSPPITRPRRSGFTLIELMVVLAIIVVIIGLLVPAVQQVRSAAARIKCQNNLKQIGLACHSYEAQHHYLPYGRKYDIWNTYTWTQLILPHLEQAAVSDLYWTLPQTGYVPSAPGPNGPVGADARLKQARETKVGVFYCPSDQAPTGSLLESAAGGSYRGSYRGCVGYGDMYGNLFQLPSGCTPGTPDRVIGIFGVDPGQSADPGARVPTRRTRFQDIKDGASNTVMISEALTPEAPGWAGPLGELIYGNMGGSLYSNAFPPNTATPDHLVGPCPNDSDAFYRAPCYSIGPAAPWTPSGFGAATFARSAHRDGVNVAVADGSVRFVHNTIAFHIWQYLGSINGKEAASFDK